MSWKESPACAEMYRRFKTEDVYRKDVPAKVRRATLEMLADWFTTLPPSYRVAGNYLSNANFSDAVAQLMGQTQEATTSPTRDSNQWALTPQMHRGLFDCHRITHVLVPVGQAPLLPWIGHAPALQSISTKRMIRFLERSGWQIAARRGKGSHIRLTYRGKRPRTLSANRESLSPGVCKSIAQALGVRLADLRT